MRIDGIALRLAVVDIEDQALTFLHIEAVEIHVISGGADLALDRDPRQGLVAHVSVSAVAEVLPADDLDAADAIAGQLRLDAGVEDIVAS